MLARARERGRRADWDPPQDAEFSVEYFKSFDFVLNALDNLGTPLSTLING